MASNLIEEALMPFGLTPEIVLSLVPTSAIALVVLQRVIEVIRVSKYGPAIAELLKALNDGKITQEEYEQFKAKL
ncbi:MAG: hypothetical protein F6J95_023720 [Leptolyngbya sp. SIO1E4]|nr:hypothetical protein [Leptolyngbya sp. SIO1E4]